MKKSTDKKTNGKKSASKKADEAFILVLNDKKKGKRIHGFRFDEIAKAKRDGKEFTDEDNANKFQRAIYRFLKWKLKADNFGLNVYSEESPKAKAILEENKEILEEVKGSEVKAESEAVAVSTSETLESEPEAIEEVTGRSESAKPAAPKTRVIEKLPELPEPEEVKKVRNMIAQAESDLESLRAREEEIMKTIEQAKVVAEKYKQGFEQSVMPAVNQEFAKAVAREIIAMTQKEKTA